MDKGRCLGLIGGLGVGATTHYYRNLAKAHEERGRTLDLVIAHAQISRVFEYVQGGDRNGLAEYLTTFIRRLEAAGAEVVAIPAVTPHFCVEELLVASPVPVFNIFEPLINELRARETRRVAVFGTRFVMESALFGFLQPTTIVLPGADEVDYIHRTYTELVQQAIGTEEQRRGLAALAHVLRQRDGVELIILAGTDFAVLFNEANTDFPHIDCAALHISAILDGLLN